MATAVKSKTRDNKITRLIIPALYDTPGLTINEIKDPTTGKPVEALYFYMALDGGHKVKNKKTGEERFVALPGGQVIEQMPEPVRTGLRGRPAKRWKLTKATRDRVRKQRQRAAK